MPEKIIMTDSVDQTAKIFGELDVNIEKLERAFGVTIAARDSSGGRRHQRFRRGYGVGG